MKRALLFLLLASPILAQSPVTVTGLITDAGNNPATSGYVQFDIQPKVSSVHYFVLGIGTITQTVQCGINASGLVKSQLNLANPCTVWGNDVISPANTQYKITLAPNGNISNVINGECITGANYSLNNPVFCPLIQITPQQAIIRSNPFQTNIIPSATGVFTIGSPTNQYASIYGSNLFLSGSATFAGNTLFKSGSPWIDVKAYGAVGDGVTDDTAAEQAAINAAKTSLASGVVFWPPGVYVTSQLTTYIGLRLTGVGMASPAGNAAGTSELLQKPGTDLDLIVASSVDHFFAFAEIDHLRLIGASGTTTSSGINFATVAPSYSTRIHDLTVGGFALDGIKLSFGFDACNIHDIQADNNGVGAGGGYGLELIGGGVTPQTICPLDSIQGDGNKTALIHLLAAPGLGNAVAYHLSIIKGEKNVAGVQNDLIVLDAMNGSPVTVNTATAINTSGEEADAVIKVVNTTVDLTWNGLNAYTDAIHGAGRGYSFMVNDAFQGVTFATDGTGTAGSNRTFGSFNFSNLKVGNGITGIGIHSQQFTSSGTFTIPVGVTLVKVTVVGGGGAGGGANATQGGSGGGGAGAAIKWLSGLTPGNTLIVTVGTGGTGVSAANGNAGVNSTVASGTQTITTIVGPGGGGGFGIGNTNGAGGQGGTGGTGGDIPNLVGNGGQSIVPGVTTQAGSGGASMFASGAGSPGVTGAGNPGGVGGGGSGALGGASAAGGAGGNGIVIFEWVQ